ncbi:putative toxin-antitoxin system toxin component, PIN family [Azospirillum sp. YIM B02556]|uniref:Toxin-antitoxin system toxin component, PIN family n=1 Tax=Azospirillum endophyticum TaxID=2800326 RepID=A0ABS1F5Y5_9PROT|nr:putative toxin-antitoxin system toxin component, PIN family [Azospirillum endophyticum]MBK1838860.1 putative toxin-antitoxin system toxin component, PIN family [Azospirillum endophyticum]
MLKIVMDTDVLFAAFHSRSGASRRLLLELLDGKLTLLLSPTLMVEYETVLTRPRNLDLFGIGIADVLSVLDELAGLCVPVAFDYRWRPVANDPDDDHVLETAINGGADAIASFNLTDLAAGARPFGIAVERPVDILRRL